MCIFCWLSYGSELMEIRMIVTAYIYLKYISSQLQIVCFAWEGKWSSFKWIPMEARPGSFGMSIVSI